MNSFDNPVSSKNALEFIDSFLTSKERAESNLRVALTGELIQVKQEKGLSQKKQGTSF